MTYSAARRKATGKHCPDAHPRYSRPDGTTSHSTKPASGQSLVIYWWVNRTPDKLGQQQIDAIETAESLVVSAMTCWEIAWLVKRGRIVLQLPVSDWLDQVEANGVAIIPVSRSIAESAVSLPEHHKNLVDRTIIATAVEHQAQLASVDGRFPNYQELAGLLVQG